MEREKEEQELRDAMQGLFYNFEYMRKINFFRLTPELNPGELRTLKAIQGLKREDRPAKVSEVVRELSCPAPLVSRTLRNLEERNLVLRETDRKDRRNTFILLTEEGEAAMQDVQTRLTAYITAVAKRMGLSEMNDFNREMLQFLKVLETELRLQLEAAEVKTDNNTDDKKGEPA